jgi:hypothetical protein
VTGALVGYASSRLMDQATGWYYRRQSQESKDTEEQIAPGGTLVQLGHQLAGLTGRQVDDEAAGRVGLTVHRSLGVTYGVIAAYLTRRGVSAWVAGPLVGSAAWLLVDEGLSLSTARDYKTESHVRGVIGHGTWGVSAGVLLSLVGRG